LITPLGFDAFFRENWERKPHHLPLSRQRERTSDPLPDLDKQMILRKAFIRRAQRKHSQTA
jgi:hypothetical protein